MRKLAIFTLFLSFFFALSSTLPAPALAKIPTGVCCRLGHPEDCPQTNGDNYICDRPSDPTCENESLGECYMAGPYDGGGNAWFEPTTPQFDQNLNDDAQNNTVSMNSYGFATITGIIQSLRRVLVGSSVPISGSGGISYNTNGAVGVVGKMIGMVYRQPPASSIEYLAYVGEKAGFVPKAYAQGVGFRGFFPLIRVWSAMRNTAYLFFAFLLIVIGLLIIFRTKVDPRTVVTIQLALPRIVIAILLVTFSYAIVGLMIDVMNVVIGVLVWVFATSGLIPDPQQTIAVIHERNALEIMSGMFGGGAGGAIADLVEGVLGGILGAVSGFIGGPIVELILAIALVSVVFKLLFTLVMAYASVIISVLMAPIQIALNAIPNINSFQAWFKNLLANLSVFPTVAAMLILAAALTGHGGRLGVEEFPGMEQTGWQAPLIGGGSQDIPQGTIPILLGYGLLMMTPGIVDQIKKLLQVPPTEVPSVGAGLGFGAKSVAGLGRTGVTAARHGLAEFVAPSPGAAATPGTKIRSALAGLIKGK